MWSLGGDQEPTVTCIACGDDVPRSRAREYDKHGDRWEREDKDFEFLCKPCDRALCHQPRDGLEATLTEANEGAPDRSTFLARYAALIEDHDEQVGR